MVTVLRIDSKAVLGTWATFNATAPLARAEKSGVGRSGAKVKNGTEA